MPNRVRVTLVGEGDSAEAALAGVERRMERVSRQTKQTKGEMRGLNRVSSAAMSSMSGLAGAAGLAAGATGLGYVVNSSLRAQEELHNLHKTTGISIERIQEYQFAARKTGIEQQRINDALAEMSQRMGEAIADYKRTGGEVTEMGEGFQAAGISMEQLQQMNPTQTFDQLSRAIQDAKTEQDALNIAAKAFGDDSGRAMVSMLREGEKAISEYIRQAHELGIILDEEVVKQSTEAKKSITTLSVALESQFARVVGELAPQISTAADNMADWVAENEDFLTQDVPGHIRDIASEVSGFAQAVSKIPEPVLYGGIGAIMGGRFGPYGAILGGGAGVAASIGPEVGRAAGRAIYGSTDSTERLVNSHRELESRLNRINRAMSNISKDNPLYANYAQQAEEVRNQMDLLERTMERLADKEGRVALEGERMWLQMANIAEQTREDTKAQEENNKARKEQLDLIGHINQRMTPPSVVGAGGPGADDEWARRAAQHREATRGMAPPHVRFGEIYAEDDKWALERLREDTESTFNYIEEFSRVTAQNMQRNFSNFFFDAWTGELDSMSDYFQSFTNSMLRIWSDMQAEMLARNLMGDKFMSGQSSEFGGLLGAIGSGVMSLFGPGSGGGTTMPGPNLFRWSGGSPLSYDSGGVLPENIYGFGRSGQSYQLHQGETGGHQINLTIVAADAKSFSDMAKRNPQAIIGPVKEALNYGDMDLRNAVRSA
jgi:hypothetical protein